jgi:hypothetical protein
LNTGNQKGRKIGIIEERNNKCIMLWKKRLRRGRRYEREEERKEKM